MSSTNFDCSAVNNAGDEAGGFQCVFIYTKCGFAPLRNRIRAVKNVDFLSTQEARFRQLETQH